VACTYSSIGDQYTPTLEINVEYYRAIITQKQCVDGRYEYNWPRGGTLLQVGYRPYAFNSH